VPPSPKFQLQDVGTPDVVSVNLILPPGVTAAGAAVKLATGIAGTGGVTVIILVVAAEPRALVTNSVTVKVPAAV
jgi:hypothetical protein